MQFGLKEVNKIPVEGKGTSVDFSCGSREIGVLIRPRAYLKQKKGFRKMSKYIS